MRISTRILFLFALWVCFAAVPCFGEGVGDFLESEGFYDASETTLPQDGQPNWGAMDETAAFRLAQSKEPEEPDDEFEDVEEDEETFSDPIEPLNRAFFVFNDKLYFWFFKPLAIALKWVFPQPVRVGVRNFFRNTEMPIRAVNCALQGNFEDGAHEVTRFLINTTAGMLGFVDAASQVRDLPPLQDEDFGQTLAVWGVPHGFYINWPVLGGSSPRDSIGLVGDWFLSPLRFVVDPWAARLAIAGVDRLNETSLVLGEYEALKEGSLDPYVAFRDGYYQFRRRKTRDRQTVW